MNPTTVQNVVTYDTVVEFSNPEMKLFPGMTAYVTIPVASATDVVRVPNGALRYKPDMKPDEIRALYAKYGITMGGGAKGKAAGSQEQRPAADMAVVWKLLPDKSIEPVQIKMGITDHTYTEVAQMLAGQLRPGDELVTGASGAAKAAGMAGGAPGMGRVGR